MISKGIINIALRVGAIVIAVHVIRQFPPQYSIYTLRGSVHWFPLIGFLILPSLVSLLIAASLWFYPGYYLKKLPVEENSENLSSLVPNEIGSILIAVIGVYILCYSITDLIYHLTYIRIMGDRIGSYSPIPPETMALIVATIVEMILGVFLIFGCSVITKFIVRFRKELKSDL